MSLGRNADLDDPVAKNVVSNVPDDPHDLETVTRTPMARPSVGKEGRPIRLLSNHFNVQISGGELVFYQYAVVMKYDDSRPVHAKGIRWKVVNDLHKTYSADFAGKDIIYDGDKSLFTVGPLPQNDFYFTVILEESTTRSADVCSGLDNGSPRKDDRKRVKSSYMTKTFQVSISYTTIIPFKSIFLPLKETDRWHAGVVHVLDIILRQRQAKRECLLVRQSYFSNDPKNFVDIGGGVAACRGLHSSFCMTSGGLSLNIDVSMTMIMTPGPVIDFLLANQNVKNPRQVDWTKARRMLKNMKVRAQHNDMVFRVSGISELPCRRQLFSMKNKAYGGDTVKTEITVADYFRNKLVELTWSVDAPCLDVGRPNRPCFLPVELCHLISLQRYTGALSSQQRTSLLEKTREKPQSRIKTVKDALNSNKYDEDPIFSLCGIQVDRDLIKIDGRVLSAPMLVVGDKEDFVPSNGRWSFNNKKLLEPAKIEHWAIVNFSACCDMSHISRELIACGRNKGIDFDRPYALLKEDQKLVRHTPIVRVEKMFEKIRAQLPGPPQFLLCILPERKSSPLYGPWKKMCLHEEGIVTQCMSPLKINEQYLTNVLLKINTKLGGMNSLLAAERAHSIPIVSQTPTLILGMDVCHGSQGQTDAPSIAAVVGSRSWPLISRYRASMRTQPPRVEIIESLCKLQPDGKDEGMIRDLLLDFYQTSGARKPSQILIFRDGVGESQFSNVLNIELNQIIQALEVLGETSFPKFTVVVAQKNHHTKLFLADSPDNVPPGTVVDTCLVHPKNYDFYMCAHTGMVGTSRPTHYHVLLDQIGFSTDDLQKLILSLSYVYQRGTAAISVVAPIRYAHLAAQQMHRLSFFEEPSTSISISQAGEAPAAFPELPTLHKNIQGSMFFC